MSLQLKINGKNKTFDGDSPQNLAQLIDRMNIDQATVVAEIDSQIVPRAKFADTTLHSGQKIELIRFVGGG